MSYFKDIQVFQKIFHQGYDGPARILNGELASFRLKFLREEIDELEEAWASSDHNKALDALVDLAYVLFGTILLCGYSRIFKRAWKRVHKANMLKELSSTQNPSKRGYDGDIVKPTGWQPPDHTDLIEEVI